MYRKLDDWTDKCMHAQLVHELYPCQLTVLTTTKLTERVYSDTSINLHMLCPISKLQINGAICNVLNPYINTMDACIDLLSQLCSACPYNNYNTCKFSLKSSFGEPLGNNNCRCTACNAIVPYDVIMRYERCPNCGRKGRIMYTDEEED